MNERGHIFLEYYDFFKNHIIREKIEQSVAQFKRDIKHKFPDPSNKGFIADSLKIVDVKTGQDGSIRTYLQGAKEPIRIFPDHRTIWVTAIYKRLLPLIAGNLRRIGWIQAICTIIAIKANKQVLCDWLEYMFNLEEVRYKEQYYSQPVREIKRVLMGKIDEPIMEAIILVLENDAAYRYRFQDMIAELDKTQLDGFKIIKEVSRLVEILKDRTEPGEVMTNKYNNIRKILILALIFSTRTRRMIRNILKEMNIDEIKFSREDLYWINQHKGGYNFRGLSLKERQEDNIKTYGSIN